MPDACLSYPCSTLAFVSALILHPLMTLQAQSPLESAVIDASAAKISAQDLMRRTQVLAHDSMLGREPGTRGDTLTTAYISNEMKRIGLTSVKGGYLQPVKLQRVTVRGSIGLSGSGRAIALVPDRQSIMVATTPGRKRFTGLPLVFVGHGIKATEFRWDDYKGVDLAGKVAVILDVEPESLSQRSFGKDQFPTYHEMWFVRARYALAHGAAGVIIVRGGTDSARANRARRLQNRAVIGVAPSSAPSPGLTVLLSTSGADKLARSVGDSIAGWRKRANDSAFVPLELPIKLSADFDAVATPFTSHNAIGIVPGSDPSRSGECVVYVSHWDGYGVGPAVKGDSIYNGALDDAAGVSVMLGIAEATLALPRAPARTTVFLATTAEESGTLGAEAYIDQPVCPMAKTALALGVDWTWTWGRTDSISSNGFGYSTVDSAAASIARQMGKQFAPGWSSYWMASDHAAFMTHGVPAWFGGLDGEVIGKPRGWAMEQLMSTQTHAPSDEILPSWDLSGALEEAQFVFRLGLHAAEMREPFRWTVDSEFARARAGLPRFD